MKIAGGYAYMPTNKIMEKMRLGQKAVGISLSFYSDEIIELAAVMGLDFVSYDGQHAPITKLGSPTSCARSIRRGS